MKEPVDHIKRPNLPWREPSRVTECGLNADSVKTLSREDYFARLKDLGQQRTAMLTCMTCGDTARRHGTWADDPRAAVAREIEWEGVRSGWGRPSDKRGVRMKDELTAIAALIEAHKDEFEAAVHEIEERRRWLEMKDEKTRKDHAKAQRRPRGNL